MTIKPNSVLLKDFPVQNMVNYLKLTGWSDSTLPNNKWIILHGSSDFNNNPLELVLPRNIYTDDISMYIANAVNLISYLSNESPEIIILRAKCYDRDVLRLKNIDVTTSSIPLQLASNQIFELKQLIAFGGSFEYSRRPHFPQALTIGTNLVSRYRFAHTFVGSFGFTIESPIIGNDIAFNYTRHRLSPEYGPDEEIREAPFERRVVERIIRGLLYTEESVNNKNEDPLVKNYKSGFNANMCHAILGMADEDRSPLEFDVLWSPKIKESLDLRDKTSIEIPTKGYSFLRSAYERLSELKPKEELVEGVIIALSSKEDPIRVSEAARAVIIHWRNRPSGRPVQLIVRLDPVDYIQATEAHIGWKTISVRGTITRTGKTWYLTDPHNFKVVD